MFRPLTHRPAPALIVACLALFVSLGGVGYAATQINGASLVNRSVKGKKLKLDTVTGKEVAESTLGKVRSAGHADRANSASNAGHAANADNAKHAGNADFATTADSANYADSATSASDLQGKGLADLLGSAVTVRAGDFGSISAGTSAEADAACNSGEKAVGGGGYIAGPGSITKDVPARYADTVGGRIFDVAGDGSTPNGWMVVVQNTGSSAEAYHVYAVCVSAAG